MLSVLNHILEEFIVIGINKQNALPKITKIFINLDDSIYLNVCFI